MALPSARKVETEADWQLVLDTVLRLSRVMARPRKLMHRSINPEKAYTYMATHGQLWLVDGYLVFFDSSSPWYSDEIILSELLVVRVERGGTFTSVTRFLEQQGNNVNASMVAAGTSFASSDRALAAMYEDSGFKIEAHLLTKEL